MIARVEKSGNNNEINSLVQSIKLVPHLHVVAVVGECDDSMAPVHQEPYPGQQAIVDARRGQQSDLWLVAC